MSRPFIHHDLLGIISAYAEISKKMRFTLVSANLRKLCHSHIYLISLATNDLRKLLDCYYSISGFSNPDIKSDDILMDKYMAALKILKIREKEAKRNMPKGEYFPYQKKLYYSRNHIGAYLYYGFMIALFHNQIELVKKILSEHSFDYKTYRCSVLEYLMVNDNYLEIIKMLYDIEKTQYRSKSNRETSDIINDGNLEIAVKSGCIEIVRWFLSKPLKLNIFKFNTFDFKTACPITESAKRGHIEILKMLLADSRINMSDRKTYLSIENSFNDVVRLCYNRNLHCAKIILDKLCLYPPR